MKKLQQMVSLWWQAPAIDRSKAIAVLHIYHQIDLEVERFRRATGLHCLPGCGQCCENPAVETSVLEVLPMAIDLWRRKRALVVLNKISDSPQLAICPFYAAHISPKALGHCQAYALRPAICRLFGFAAAVNKHGQQELVTCQRIKEECSPDYAQACQRMATGLKAPQIADYSRRIALLDLTLGQERLPISQAIRTALERVGLLYEMKG